MGIDGIHLKFESYISLFSTFRILVMSTVEQNPNDYGIIPKICTKKLP